MDEYISKQAFLDYMKRTDRYFSVKFDIENFPTADVAPIVHGRWKRYGKNLGECSECGEIVSVRSNYCPNCGAKMDGGIENG